VGPRGLVNKKGTTVRVSLTHCLPLPPPPGEVVRVALPPPPVEWPAGWPVSFSTSTSRRLVPSPYSSPSSWCLPLVRRVAPVVGRWPSCSSRRRSPTGLRASAAMRSKGAGAAGAAVVTKDADCGLRAIVKNSGAPRRVAMVPSVKP
jgi:hypothetical protein